MEEMLSSLKDYFTELDKMQMFLEAHCRNIQLALHALDNRCCQIEKLYKQKELVEKDRNIGLSVSQMDEIDVLIKKAEKVLVVDVGNKDGKKKNMRKPVISSTNRKNMAVSDQVISRREKNCTVTGSKLVKKSINKNLSKSTVPGTAISEIHEFCPKTDLVDLQKAIKLSLYDPNFKAEYSVICKQKKCLSKLKTVASLEKDTSDSISEFISNLQPENDGDILDTIVDMKKIPGLTEPGFTNKEITDTLITINGIKKVGNSVTSLYTNILDPYVMVSNNKSMNNYTKNGEFHHNMPVFINNSLLNNDTVSTKKLKSYLNVIQLTYNIIIKQKMKQLMENHLSLNEGDLKKNVSQYRQLCLLLYNSNGFLSLAKDQ